MITPPHMPGLRVKKITPGVLLGGGGLICVYIYLKEQGYGYIPPPAWPSRLHANLVPFGLLHIAAKILTCKLAPARAKGELLWSLRWDLEPPWSLVAGYPSPNRASSPGFLSFTEHSQSFLHVTRKAGFFAVELWACMRLCAREHGACMPVTISKVLCLVVMQEPLNLSFYWINSNLLAEMEKVRARNEHW